MATLEEYDSTILNAHEERSDAADSWLATTETVLNELRLALKDGIDDLLALGVEFNVTNVDADYVAPAAPAALDASTVSIGDVEWDRIFNRAAAKEAAIGVAEEYTAASEAAARGMAIPSFVSEMHVTGAQQRAMDRISALAEASATEQAKAAREDILKAQAENLDRYAKQVASETARLGYETLQLEKAIKPEQIAKEFELKATELALINTNQELVQLMQVYAQITQALISGSNVNIGSSLSRKLEQIVYNPSLGQVVQSPA